MENKTILITGAGSLGCELIKRLYPKNRIVILSRSEEKLHALKLKYPEITTVVGDIRQPICISSVDIVIHTAALKHVQTGIDFPFEVIETNIIGTQNVIKYCLENEVQKAVYISTDKAVEPFNLYGATKFIGEKLWMFGNREKEIFSCIRFGNLWNSSGSFIEYLTMNKHLEKITVTEKETIRYFITLRSACEEVENICEKVSGFYVIDSEAAKIGDIVKVLHPFAKIEEIGLKEGEKLIERIYEGQEEFRLMNEDGIREFISNWRKSLNE